MAGRIELMRRGRAAGSPISAVHPDVDGALITRHDGVVLSVWDWADAASLEEPFTAAHTPQIGTALGRRLHAALAEAPASRYKEHEPLVGGAAEALAARGHELLALIDQVAEPSEEDLRRREQVAARIAGASVGSGVVVGEFRAACGARVGRDAYAADGFGPGSGGEGAGWAAGSVRVAG